MEADCSPQTSPISHLINFVLILGVRTSAWRTLRDPEPRLKTSDELVLGSGSSLYGPATFATYHRPSSDVPMLITPYLRRSPANIHARLAIAADPERTRVRRMHCWLDKDGGSGCGSYT